MEKEKIIGETLYYTNSLVEKSNVMKQVIKKLQSRALGDAYSKITLIQSN